MVTDYAGQADTIMLPLLAWLRVKQPELLINPDRRANAIQFDVELLSHESADIEIKLPLTERVVVKPSGAGGALVAEHADEPADAELPAEDEEITIVIPARPRLPSLSRRGAIPMSDDFSDVQAWAAALLALRPAERRRVNRAVAVELRRTEGQRIAAQQNPDGTPYAPRRTKNLRGKRGAIRRKMFTRLRTARYLRVEASDTDAVVGYSGRVARLALVHQEGRSDRPARGQKPVRYPRRKLLGFTERTREMVLDTLARHLAGQGL